MTLRAPGTSVSGWHETSGWAMVNFISANSPRAALPDDELGVVVGLGAGDPDRIQAQLFAQPPNVLARHARIVP